MNKQHAAVQPMDDFLIVVTDSTYGTYAQECARLIERASKEPNAALALRKADYLKEKIDQGKAVIAFSPQRTVIGFCYIEAWEDANYIANSGLVVDPEYRGYGLAKEIKRQVFLLSQQLFPNATLFGLTTSKAVMQINSELGYQPVTFADITSDDQFWKGCEGCCHHEILTKMNRTNCLCTAMVYRPKKKGGD